MATTIGGGGIDLPPAAMEANTWENHPLRMIREVVDAALGELAGELARLRSERLTRPIPPERLLRAMLLQAFYGIRSERQLMAWMEVDHLLRWFVGFEADDVAWDHPSFVTNRDRLLAGAIARKFLAAVIVDPQVKRLLASDHFSVDGTLLMAWASGKRLAA
ncbi:MAG: transposase [Rhodospirillales bacterium]|nr:transposase [Rhodospirillales bacterium]